MTETSIGPARPDYFEHEEFTNRQKKLQEVLELGVDPYPHKYTPSHKIGALQNEYEGQSVGNSEEAGEGSTPEATVAGRLVLFRAMGKNAFGQIQGETQRIQVMFNRDLSRVAGYDPESVDCAQPPSHIKFIEKRLDLGDIIGVKGHLFRTQKGELTIFAKEVTLLCKSLLPLADKHGGLSNKETRYRKRWLDLISHADVKETFRRRSQILRTLRNYCEEQDFMEVETPVLQTLYGGAEARPFVTELNSLSQEMFMRISLEIPLKKLLVGGLERVFEIGRVFRNEGIDRTHNPEFTLMEAYAAFWDYNDMMRFVENLYERLAKEIFGDTKIPFGTDPEGNPFFIDVKAPWTRLTLKGSIAKYLGIEVDELSEQELQNLVLEGGKNDPKEVKKLSRGLLIATLFEDRVEPYLVQPHHITDYPIETTPLCKPHRNAEDRAQGYVERFESYILGDEICNAYSELNNPVIQRELLEKQASKRDAGDEEASPLDEEFLEAICQGMPPTGGVGIGIDRLVMLFTGSTSIRDVLFFPWMKPTD